MDAAADAFAEQAAEIKRLRMGLLSAEHLLLAAHGPEDGPTGWEATRARWLKEWGVSDALTRFTKGQAAEAAGGNDEST